MKITAIETIRLEEFANLLWVRVHTDEGLTGLGETFFMARTVEAYIHEVVAPQMLGRDPLAIDRIAKDLTGYLGFRSTGAEMRGNSAFDIALWDLFGKVDRPADRPASRRLLARPDPHLQHLRRQRLYARTTRARAAPIGGAAPSAPTTISTPS